jgi:hypothetical protein
MVEIMKKILIAKEKYGDRYFDVSSIEQLYKVALYLVKQRFEQGYWYKPADPVEPLDFNEDDLQKIPESLRARAKQTLESHKEAMKKCNQYMNEYQEIQEAIKNSDGRQALHILNCRKGYEYEEVKIEDCEEIVS